MKANNFSKLAILAIVIFVIACNRKEGDHSHQSPGDSNSWKEMDDFHMVMAETFHPYKDSADLEPIKQKSGELAGAADKWASSSIPEKVDSDATKSKLQNLKSETEVLADLVQKGDDAAIGAQLTKVHDLFHEIQEDWYGGGEHKHDH